MSKIIEGKWLTGNVITPQYVDHIDSSREKLQSYNEAQVRGIWDELIDIISKWIYQESPFQYESLGLADAHRSKDMFIVPNRIPSQYRFVVDLMLLILISFEYPPLIDFVKKYSLGCLTSIIVLNRSELGSINELDRSIIWMIWFEKKRMSKYFDEQAQQELRNDNTAFDAKIACLENWLEIEESHAKRRGESFDRYALTQTREQMRKILNNLYPKVFRSMSPTYFPDFWQKQKICSSKSGQRVVK